MKFNKESTGTEMYHFYGDYVHEHLFENQIASLKKYRIRLIKELDLLNIKIDDLKDKVVFDIGTGFQSIVFAELGCKHVYHVDINQRQVDRLREYCETYRIKKISTECIDIATGLGSVPEIDIAFVYGVYHHLENPAVFFAKLFERTLPNASVLMRCYRSGSWSRWIVAYLRTLAVNTDIDSVTNAFKTMFPLEENKQFLSDMLDDLFVPVWGCFNPRQFYNDSRKLGINFYSNDNDPDFCFSSLDENFRFRLDLTENVNINEGLNKLESSQCIDQLSLNIPELKLSGFHEHWEDFCSTMNGLSSKETALRILSLYRLSRSMNQVDYFRIANLRPEQNNDVILGDIRLQALIKVLRAWT